MSGNRAECARYLHDPELWFSEKQADISEAKSICLGVCPVQSPCLLLALEYEGSSPTRSRFGVWGGYSAAERGSMARRGVRPAASGDPPDVAA